MGIGNGIGVRWGKVAMASGPVVNEAFEFTVKTDNAGTSASNQFTIPITSATPYNISTSDGQSITGATGATTLTFPSAGTYTVSITDSCEGWSFNNRNDRLKLLNISNWGVYKNTASNSFYGAQNMTCSAVDAPINAHTTMQGVFRNCYVFNGAIGNWDVSQVARFDYAFSRATQFNQPLNNWNTSSATIMSNVFNNIYYTKGEFNQNISSWDVSNVTTFANMLNNTRFNHDLSSWDVSSLTVIAGMFAATPFNYPLNNWVTSSVTSLEGVFAGATSFNQDLSSWDVSNVTSLRNLFASATSFNQDISGWDVSSVTNLEGTFNNADAFSYDISGWNMPNLTNMARSFASIPWNPNISGWDVSNVTSMQSLFQNNTANITDDFSGWNTSNVVTLESFGQGSNFNGDISAWDVSSVTNLRSFMYGNTTFSGTLSSWDTSSVTTMIYNPFYQTQSYDDDLGGWDVSNVSVIGGPFKSGIPFSTANYDSLLSGWEASLQAAYPGGVGYPYTIGVSFPGSQYTLGSAAEAARTSLISTYGWTITDGGGIFVPFTMTVDTTLGDGLAQFTIPTTGTGYNYDVVTSDGQSITGNTGNTTITFPASGTYDIEITGDFPRIYFNNGGDRLKLTDIVKWGSIAWVDMEDAFHGCNNLTVSATDAPNLSGVTNMDAMFARCNVFNSNINHWDVSTITDMGSLFFDCFAFNQPLDNWDVSNNTDFGGMFRGVGGVTTFNQDISGWNTSSATNMSYMFGNSQFNQPIGNWDVSGVTNFQYMFSKNFAFDQPLNSWNMSGKTNLSLMFHEARVFNQDLDSWDVSACTNMSRMFENATLFNGNITTWNTSNVTLMNGMFNMWWGGARPFNQNLNSWDVSNVTNMSGMFAYCINYNQPMTSWNTTNVTNMQGMFSTMYNFNQDISMWDVSNVTNMREMLERNHAFNQDISGWNVGNVTSFHRFMNMQGTTKGSFNFDISGWNTSSATDFTNAFYNTSMTSNLANWDIDQVTVFTNFKTAGDPLSTADYDATLVSWENQLQIAYPGGVGYTPTISINFNSSTYSLGSAAETARTSLINTYGWTITDGGGIDTSFEFTVDTTQAGTSGSDQFTIPITSATPYNISTSDGQSITGATGATTITFPAPGTYTINITGSCEGWKFSLGGDRLKMLNISNWGVYANTAIGSFYGASNMTCSATDIPIGIHTTLRGAFQSCSNFNGAIGNWDVSNVTSMLGAFTGATSFNQDISSWDVSNVTDMGGMFNGATSFNRDLNTWNTSNVTNMADMFRNNPGFNSNITTWDVSSVTSFQNMFLNQYSTGVFNQDISGWNVSSATNFFNMFYNTNFNQPIGSWTINTLSSVNMAQMFGRAASFNQPIGSWDVSSVTNMRGMFNNAQLFNQNIGSWNTSLVTNMTAMFAFTNNFNNGGDPSINNWNTSNVTSMLQMFYYAQAFNQPIGNWDVSLVTGTGLQSMFDHAQVFNQDLSTWNVTSNITSLSSAFNNARVFNSDISGWDVSGVTNMASMFIQAYDFNQDISGWNTSNVVNFNTMFRFALDFNQPIGSWNTSSATNMNGMLENTQLDQDLSSWDINQVTLFGNFKSLGAPLSTANYDALLVAWEAQAPQSGITISFGNSQYSLGSAAETARTSLISTFGWTITDGGGIAPAVPDYTTNLVASYNFDSDFTDYTRNNPLTPSGGTPPVAGVAGGIVSNCAEFNSTGDYTLAADSNDLSFTDGVNDLPFSVSFWANFTSYDAGVFGGAWLLSKRDASTNEEYQILYFQNELGFVLFSGGGNTNFLNARIAYPPPIGSWHHYAFTYDGSATFAGLKIYIDGVSQSVTNASVGTYTGMINGTQAVNIGSRAWQPSVGSFWGKLDEYHIWKNRELTAAEVLDIYNTENAGTSILPEPQLLDSISDAEVAYSLRNLKNSTTNVVRVRRTSDNTEQDFTATEVTDGTLETFVGVGNDGHVSVWYDQSGNANNLAQATTTNQPKLVSNGGLIVRNGKPSVEFDGPSTQYLTQATDLAIAQADGFIVAEAKNYPPIYTGASGADSGLWGYSSAIYSNHYSWTDTTIYETFFTDTRKVLGPSPITLAQLNLYNVLSKTNEYTAILNANQLFTTASNTVAVSSPQRLGYTHSTPSNKFALNGYVSEFIIFNQDKSADRSYIESNINNYYTIY